jgi:hypothetical protein
MALLGMLIAFLLLVALAYRGWKYLDARAGRRDRSAVVAPPPM